MTDLFDVSVSENIMEILNNGGKLYVTFKTNYSEKPVIIHRSSENWEVFDSSKVSLKDGQVTAEFTSLSPVGFLSLSSDDTPSAGNITSRVIWATIFICLLLVGAAIIIVILKLSEQKDNNKKKSEEQKDESEKN